MDKSIKFMKKQKILITGILGYIARDICEAYKMNGYDIIGIDCKFDPIKVKWLTENGIKYYQRDLFNIKDLLSDVYLIIHTAGITTVPTVKSKSNLNIDSEIIKTGVDGTRELIKHSPHNCKFIFLSTHVIFESLTTQVLNIDETFTPCPNLAYSTSKYQSELDILSSNKKSIILRLGSVYGYNEHIRCNVLSNLFSKLAAVDGKLKVFGNGNNIKPLVGVSDVGKVIFHLDSLNFNQQIFNVANEHITVKELANICKLYAPHINIEFTDDEIPNNGYSLSTEKLKNTGFIFSTNINSEIKKMIGMWSY